MADVWRKLLDAASEGKAIQVSVPPGARIKRQRRPKAGRPRTRGPLLFGDYAGYDPAQGGRPYCFFRGCNKNLKKDQPIACCPEHEALVVQEAEEILRKAKREAA